MKQPPYKYMVRLPVPMRDLIAESARHYRRSMNSDIVARLQHSFSGLGATTLPGPEATANGSGSDDQPATEEERAAGLEPPMFDQFETLFRRDLSAQEELLVRSFRRLPSAKREALLALLR